jgi:hypothetical protein
MPQIHDYDIKIARRELERWARWHLSGDGYAARSSIVMFTDGGGMGRGVSESRLPAGVVPPQGVRLSARALRHLRVVNQRAAGLITQIYLDQQPMRALALREQVSLSQINRLRRSAEGSFAWLFFELLPDSVSF